TADKKYELAEEAIIHINGKSASLTADAEFDYAKVVLDKRNEIKFLNAYNWEDHIVVKEIDETVALGYKNAEDVDLEDYVIVKDGATIGLEDIEQGDILYFDSNADNGNNEKGYAEVFNGTVT